MPSRVPTTSANTVSCAATMRSQHHASIRPADRTVPCTCGDGDLAEVPPPLGVLEEVVPLLPVARLDPAEASRRCTGRWGADPGRVSVRARRRRSRDRDLPRTTGPRRAGSPPGRCRRSSAASNAEPSSTSIPRFCALRCFGRSRVITRDTALVDDLVADVVEILHAESRSERLRRGDLVACCTVDVSWPLLPACGRLTSGGYAAQSQNVHSRYAVSKNHS